MSGSRGLGVALIAVVASACASHTAPSGFLPDTREAQTSSYGGWVEMTVRAPSGTARVSGELIAASADSLWVLTLSETGRVVGVADVADGQLVSYDSRAEQLGAVTLLGVISTISNGAFLIFTAPMWMVGGSVAAASQSKLPIERVPSPRWEALAAYARFPQGMPPGLALDELRPVRR